MQDVFAAYHLHPPPVQSFLSRSSVLVTGSTALWVYLQQQGIVPGFTPAGLDVWVHSAEEAEEFAVLLQHFGHYQQMGDEGAEEVKHEEAQIQRWIRHEDQRIVRVQIVTEDVPLSIYLYSYVDLSPCMSWWNPVSERCETAFPALTDQRIMWVMNGVVSDERLQKYMARGFTMDGARMAPQQVPKVIESLDARGEEMGALGGCKAYDVIGVEEVDAGEWLRASPWNVLLHVAEAFHAYDRRILLRCMREKVTFLPHYYEVFDTPHHQSVTEDVMEMMGYGDWSVYVFFPEGVIAHKTIYRVHACTVAQFVTGDVGVVLMPPPPPHPEDPPVRAYMDNADDADEDDIADLPPLELVREPVYAESDQDDE